MFGPDLEPQDKLDIDFVVNYVGKQWEAEQREKDEKESK